jgi:hypothetical protein
MALVMDIARLIISMYRAINTTGTLIVGFGNPLQRRLGPTKISSESHQESNRLVLAIANKF